MEAVQTLVQIPAVAARLTSSRSIFSSNCYTPQQPEPLQLLLLLQIQKSSLCMLQILSLSPSYTAPSSFTQKINSVCGKAGEAAGFSQESSDSA